MKRFSRWILFGLLIAGAVLFYLYRMIFSTNVSTPEGKEYEFLIPTGADYAMVAEKLKTDKIITDAQAFHWVAQMMEYTHNVKPGRYVLEDGMSTRSLISLLRSGNQKPVRFYLCEIQDEGATG